ncbi:MAG: Calcium/proton exchanger [Actinomycetia bacterium]|nr:Calcium/proton exchanger [Actinomycetes bacterium]
MGVNGAVGVVARRALPVLLVLGPVAVALDWLGAAGKLTIFLVAAAALIPLAWVIGEATDNASYYTGPGIGGFLNATFGNAPELIIAIVAVSDGLTEVVRASLVGSVVGNLLLVLGFTLLLGQRGTIDRWSAAISLGMVALATLFVFVTSVPSFHGDPDRRSLAEFSLPIAVVLLLVRVSVMRYALRRQRALRETSDPTREAGWPLRVALAMLGAATVVTAFVTNSLVGSLQTFASSAHLSEFLVAVVIVAIVGNATEHGSAVLLARRGRVRLATEISLASSAQVAALLIPLVAVASWTIEPLALSFRPVELGALAVATALPALVLAHGRTTRLGGSILLSAYAGLVVAFYYSGNR